MLSGKTQKSIHILPEALQNWTSGVIFSKVSPWFTVVDLMAASRKIFSALEMQRQLDYKCCQKT